MDLVAPVGAARFEYGALNGLEMPVLNPLVRLGGEANFRLRNTAGEVRGTGTEHFYALQQ